MYYASWLPTDFSMGLQMFQGIQQQLMSMDRQGICLPFGSDIKSVEMVVNQPQIKGGLVFAANPETEVGIQELGLPCPQPVQLPILTSVSEGRE